MQTDHGQEHEGRDQYGTVTPFPIPARIPVFPTGCVGRLASVQPLADGRSNILLQGLERFEIEREWYDKAYREATIAIAIRGTEAALDPMVRQRLFTILESYLRSRDGVPTWQEFFREEVSDVIVVHTLSTYLDCTPLEKQFLLEANSLQQQARRLKIGRASCR